MPAQPKVVNGHKRRPGPLSPCKFSRFPPPLPSWLFNKNPTPAADSTIFTIPISISIMSDADFDFPGSLAHFRFATILFYLFAGHRNYILKSLPLVCFICFCLEYNKFLWLIYAHGKLIWPPPTTRLSGCWVMGYSRCCLNSARPSMLNAAAALIVNRVAMPCQERPWWKAEDPLFTANLVQEQPAPRASRRGRVGLQILSFSHENRLAPTSGLYKMGNRKNGNANGTPSA